MPRKTPKKTAPRRPAVGKKGLTAPAPRKRTKPSPVPTQAAQDTATDHPLAVAKLPVRDLVKLMGLPPAPEPTGKRKPGQPTKYVSGDNGHAEWAKRYCLMGATNEDLSRLFDISLGTLDNWCKAHPEFLSSIKEGRAVADARVGQSLFDKATGYYIPEEELFVIKGKIKRVTRMRYVAPDTRSIVFWLKNRRPMDWRDAHEITGAGGGPIQTENKHEVDVGRTTREVRIPLKELEAIHTALTRYKESGQSEIIDITPKDKK